MYEKYMRYFYTDRLSIIRYKAIPNVDGTDGQELDLSSEITDVHCHISVLKADELSTVNVDANEVSARFKIFLSNSVDIRKDDKLIVDKFLSKRKVQSYEGKASDPVFYDLAQEIILLERRVKADVKV